MKAIRTMAAAALAVLCALTPPARAESAAAWTSNDQGSVGLLSAATATGGRQTVQLGLDFRLKPGWKIYWRSPGDAGFPPSVAWTGSDNLAGAALSWPGPHRFSISGLETMGYKGEVVLPLAVRLKDPARPLVLKAAVEYLVCAVVCIPQHASLALTLPAGPAQPGPEAHLISRFLARVPGPPATRGMRLDAVEATPEGGLRVVVEADPPLLHPDLFLERADQMQFTPPVIRLEDGGRRMVATTAPVSKTGSGGLSAQPLTLTIVDGDRGAEAVATVAPARPGADARALLAMLGVALLGGLLLNLMPCVLPVLSIKVLGVISHGGAERRAIRASFLASAAGIVASFLLLALAAAALKLAGRAVGWGVQFQQPLFLIALVAVVTLFAANLLSLFEIPLPAWAARLGERHGHGGGPVGHFVTGMFATLLATPCSAPFLGTAVGFALGRGVADILAIFLALGLGMALPYLLVAAWPRLAQSLPRPGRWMLILRRLLGVALLLTGLWMLSVLEVETGARAALAVGLLMLALLALLAATRRLAAPRRLPLAALPVLAALAVPATGLTTAAPARDAAAAARHLWHPFDRAAIARQVAAGRLVFVDVTAEWCITCQVNKATVVYRGRVAQRLDQGDIMAMQADWTRPDAGIAAYLAGFGRYAIPFDAVYGPGAPAGIALPELLSEDAVMDAIARAEKAAPPARSP
ncbi:thiol:disulfide interchange protein DsbD precursor [mine drainage metagenome]|uniref:Thiol:disulfide interchange protein DsbD n=1 Tax=mine drainage metagenome TaxID=410659 RepID=A0A1J5RYB1_9ZZZZ